MRNPYIRGMEIDDRSVNEAIRRIEKVEVKGIENMMNLVTAVQLLTGAAKVVEKKEEEKDGNQ